VYNEKQTKNNEFHGIKAKKGNPATKSYATNSSEDGYRVLAD
jgi:hypothetical protein